MKSASPLLDMDSIEAQILNLHGFKITQPRFAVLSLLKGIVHPISSQEICDSIDNQVANQATIYRIIQSFLEAGIIREVNLRHGHIDYELARDEDDHHHLVCVSCGLVENFEECETEKIIKRVLKQTKKFASIHEHAMELFGICKACTKKNKKTTHR
ncbi:MAG: Fur family transcriptional regulator [Candidatus Uhrbacteria bacterium]|nr:Fur family transcriptional regulator [Candidatus Uhrbacteria bacterium]